MLLLYFRGKRAGAFFVVLVFYTDTYWAIPGIQTKMSTITSDQYTRRQNMIEVLQKLEVVWLRCLKYCQKILAFPFLKTKT